MARTEIGGLLTYDIRRAEGKKSKKSLLILPGITGHSQEQYIMDLADQASLSGYDVLIVNPVAPPEGFGDETGLEVCDFTHNIYLE